MPDALCRKLRSRTPARVVCAGVVRARPTRIGSVGAGVAVSPLRTTVGASIIVIANVAAALADALSVTWTVKRNAPLVAGRPVMTPVEELRDNAAGSVPVLIAQVYGAVPPSAISVAEYAMPAAPFGSDVVVIAMGV